MPTGLVIDFNGNITVDSQFAYNNQGITDLATNEVSYVMKEDRVPSIVVNRNKDFEVTYKYETACIHDIKTGNKFLVSHDLNLQHLRIGMDSKYVIAASKDIWTVTCINMQMLYSLNLLQLKLICWLYKQNYLNQLNKEYVIVLDEYQNKIFNSLPRFMQKALESHYKIEYRLFASC